MILSQDDLKKSPDVRVNAIHNSKQDGTNIRMNFELSNGYVTKQTDVTNTPYQHVIPDAVFTHTTQVLVHFGNIIWGFRFLDA